VISPVLCSANMRAGSTAWGARPMDREALRYP
jgi:hypothetical protein